MCGHRRERLEVDLLALGRGEASLEPPDLRLERGSRACPGEHRPRCLLHSHIWFLALLVDCAKAARSVRLKNGAAGQVRLFILPQRGPSWIGSCAGRSAACA